MLASRHSSERSRTLQFRVGGDQTTVGPMSEKNARAQTATVYRLGEAANGSSGQKCFE